ncbi:MAG: peptide chain release factor N(5)-glutamine methyltransferase [bacterium]|nr:peptide chain release factor N(5)-glutamine methyltransferase [bacterium]
MPTLRDRVRTIGYLLDAAVNVLKSAGVPSPRVDAETLALDVLGIERHELADYPDRELDEVQLKRFIRVVRRRAEREPLQLILGWAPFLDIQLDVIPGVFIPRPETEGLAELCLSLLEGIKHPFIVETCAGTGAISLWLKSKIEGARIIAIDKHGASINCLKANANILGYDIKILHGNLLDPVVEMKPRRAADMVVANPPYISSLEMTMLPPEIIGWEARSALHGGLSGTDFYPGIIDGAAFVLRKNGVLALEIGEYHAEEISAKIEKTALFDDINVKEDLAGRPRYLYCYRNGNSLKRRSRK